MTDSPKLAFFTAHALHCFSVMACVSADGVHLPPLIIFPAKNLHSTWHGTPGKVPEGTTYKCSNSSWMTTEIFLKWFNHFVTVVH